MNERSEKREKKDDGTRSASSGGNGSASAGTVLRTPGRETAVTAKKSEPASDAVQADGQQVWSAKSLPVWQPGDLISGVYKVEEVRAGGMGRVYMCRHEKWRVKVALKSPNEMMLSDKALFARILREAEAWTELGMHPNIAYCYFVHTIDEVPHIVVEYVDGGSLEEWIQEGKCIDYRTNLDLAIQFCHAMEHAHLKGMIHRDIKPQNVLMTRDGTLKVTDFGLVSGGKPVEADLQRTSSDPGNAGLTAIGTFMGTPGYMAPEQAVDAGSVDARADIFSFGVCLYEMFCGNKPYQTTLGDPETPGDPKTLSHDPDFPPALTPVLLKCVQWDHEARYSRFQEIRLELNAIHRKLFGADSAYAEVNLVGLDADGMNNRGVSFYELGRESEAEASFRAALEADALHPQATYNLGLLEWRSGSIADDEVVRRMETRLKDAGTSKNILNSLLAQIHMERMHPDDAQTVLRDHPGQFDNLFSNSPPAGIKLRAVMEGHQSGVKAVRFKDGNRYVISVDGRAALRRWDCRTGEALSSSQLYSDTISA
ncbi:MAG: protein kinase, partial [Desulfobacteraceae bacterium]